MTTRGLTVVKGQIFSGNGETQRHVVVDLRLSNQTTQPISMLAGFFRLRLSNGIEVGGNDLVTRQRSNACPVGDLSKGATSEVCSIVFQVDLSKATVRGVAYVLPDNSQWVVDVAMPTCEQCGGLDGCFDLGFDERACGACGAACEKEQTCWYGVCGESVHPPTAATCEETCAPSACRDVSYWSKECAQRGKIACSTAIADSGCTAAELGCICN